jgi:hypothetical protein
MACSDSIYLDLSIYYSMSTRDIFVFDLALVVNSPDLPRGISDAVAIHPDLPGLRTSSDRDHACGCVSVLLRLRELRSAPEATSWRLLCVLFLRHRAMPTHPGERQRQVPSVGPFISIFLEIRLTLVDPHETLPA